MAPPGLSRDALIAQFEPYELRLRATICDDPRIELWETGWGEALTLTPDEGRYDDFQVRRVKFLIERTIPPGWNLGRKGPG